MKKLSFLIIVFAINSVIGQKHQFTNNSDLNSISKRLNILEKKNKKFNFFVDFQGSLDAYNEGSSEMNTNFKIRNLYIELQGNLTDKLFYKVQHRLNKSNRANSLDNLSSATDLAYVGYHFNDKFTIIFGKQFQYWGGFEYDLSPVDIYEYSDYGNNIDCFMLGATFVYDFNKNNEFIFQITDSRANKFEDIYGDLSSQNIKKSTIPLTYIFNWIGNFWDNKLKTSYAVGLQTEAQGKYTYSTTLGAKLNLSKFQLSFDYMRDNSDIDRLGILSSEMKNLPNSPKVFENVIYNSFIAKAEYQPVKKWNVFVKGMYETADGKTLANNFRKSLGYFSGVEYYPFKDEELRIFLIYVGRKVIYKESLPNFNTNRFSLGLIYRMKAF